jgi:hypothetical protein
VGTVGPFKPSPWVDLNRPYLNCGIAGECYIGDTDWKRRYLESCPYHNRIYGLW